jgi:hypothetical protein
MSSVSTGVFIDEKKGVQCLSQIALNITFSSCAFMVVQYVGVVDTIPEGYVMGVSMQDKGAMIYEYDQRKGVLTVNSDMFKRSDLEAAMKSIDTFPYLALELRIDGISEYFPNVRKIVYLQEGKDRFTRIIDRVKAVSELL